jgi:hypothetical protein
MWLIDRKVLGQVGQVTGSRLKTRPDISPNTAAVTPEPLEFIRLLLQLPKDDLRLVLESTR